MDTTTAAKASSDERLYVDIHYHVVYTSTDENLGIDLLRSQHQMLNASYNNVHTSIGRVPSSGRYAFASVIGKASVVFLPSNYTELQESSVSRISANRSFSGLQDVVNWLTANGHTMISGSINLIICPLSSVLGEAQVPGNTAVVSTGSVGGEVLAGSLTQYHLGVTAVHELGHLFGLPHVFDGDCMQTFTDIPAQLYPNYNFQLQHDGEKWDGTLCNRYRDCEHYQNGDTSVLLDGQSPPYSCFSCSASVGATCDDCTTELFEQACNFMGYSTDEHLTMFSGEQCTFMRSSLLSGDMGVTIRDSDGGDVLSVSGMVAEDLSVAEGADSGDSEKATAVLSVPVIVGISAGAAVLFIAIVATIIWRRRDSKE